jgi:hypothetical protein
MPKKFAQEKALTASKEKDLARERIKIKKLQAEIREFEESLLLLGSNQPRPEKISWMIRKKLHPKRLKWKLKERLGQLLSKQLLSLQLSLKEYVFIHYTLVTILVGLSVGLSSYSISCIIVTHACIIATHACIIAILLIIHIAL